MKVFASFNEHEFNYEASLNNDAMHLFKNGHEADYDFISLGNGRYSLIKDNKSYLVHLLRQNDLYYVHVNGAYYAISVEDERMRKLKELVAASNSGPAEQLIKAPIPGFVLKINVTDGEIIRKGDSLLILEAMKMENIIKSPCDCRVEKIMIKEEEAVQQNQDLIWLTANEISTD